MSVTVGNAEVISRACKFYVLYLAKVILLVEPVTHCIAQDLIGFAQSGKPDIDYRFVDHVRYLDAFIEEAAISSAYVVVEDWETALVISVGGTKA